MPILKRWRSESAVFEQTGSNANGASEITRSAKNERFSFVKSDFPFLSKLGNGERDQGTPSNRSRFIVMLSLKQRTTRQQQQTLMLTFHPEIDRSMNISVPSFESGQEVVVHRPEWLRIPNAVKIFGISRTKFYELIAQRKIKSVSLRERGQVRGIRLLSYDSISDYLESLAKQQD